MSDHRRICFVGDPGAGRTSRLQERFVASVFTERPALWLLSSAGLAEHVKDLVLSEQSESALAENQITTFDRWAEPFLNPGELVVNAHELRPLVQAILDQGLFPEFENTARLPGFARSLCRAAGEMLENQVTAEKLLSVGGPRKQRLAALGRVVAELGSSMTRKRLVLPGQLLFRLAEAIDVDAFDLPDLLLLDGFYDFTVPQRTCLEALVKRSIDIETTLPTAKSDSIVTAAAAFLESLGFSFEQSQGRSRGEGTALGDLYSGLFSGNSGKRDPEGLEILEAETVEMLLETIAVEIASGRAENDPKPWRNTGLICRMPERYAKPLARIFDRYRIPWVFHGRFNCCEVGPGPALLAMLEALGKSRPETRVERVERLRSLIDLSFCTCDPDTAGRIRFLWNFELGDEGNTRRRNAPPETLADLMSATREGTLERDHLSFLAHLDENARECNSVERFAELCRLLVNRYAQRAFEAAELPGSGIELAASVVRNLVASVARMERVVRALGREDLAYADLVSELVETLNRSGAGFSGRLADAVHVVDVFEARNWVWDRVYLLGMNEGEFPRRFSENVFSPDADRERIAPALATAKRSMEAEQLLFRFAATRATQSLVLARHRFDDEGAETSPSFFLDEVSSLFVSPIEKREAPLTLSAPILPPDYWRLKDHAVSASAYALGQAHFFSREDDPVVRAGSFLYEKRIAGDRLPADRDSWLFSKFPNALPPSLADAVSGRIAPFSPTAVETFQACAFRNFCRGLLRLSPALRTPVLDPPTLGSIAHDALKEYFESGMRGSIADALRIESAKHLAGIDLGFDEEQALFRLRDWLWNLVEAEKDRLKLLSAEPVQFEWPFGRESEWMLTAGDRSEPFLGRVDRIDRLGNGLLVIDYKLSGGLAKGDLPAIEQGLSLQLVVYLVAASQLLNQELAGAQITAIKRNQRSGFFDRGTVVGAAAAVLDEEGMIGLESAEFKELIDRCTRAALEACAKMRSGKIAIEPIDPASTCSRDRCNYYDICRIAL
jgi:ATP-dependent helicase/DNAse subunit B